MFGENNFYSLTFAVALSFTSLQYVSGEEAGSSSPTNASSSAQSTAAPVNKPFLQGGVNHAEELPGVEESLRPGKVYSDDLLRQSAESTNDLWYVIPPWFAGTRHVEDCVVMYRYDYKTHRSTTPMLKQLNRQDSLSGYLQDKTGGIWDYKNIPTIQHVESDVVNAIIYVKKITPVESTADKIVIKYEELSITVSKEDNKILQVLQQEQINTITSPDAGTLHIDISVKCFDYDGTPNRLEQSVSIAKIVKPFSPQTMLNGIDLQPLFKDYLTSHGLENLVPASGLN